MLSFLPLVSLALAAVACARRNGGKLVWDSRDALLAGALFVGMWAAVGAELLSAFRAFSVWPVVAWWAAPCAVLSIRLFCSRPSLRRGLLTPGRDPLNLSILAVAAAILILTGIVAAFTPPTTWDSIGYHLPRQLYWIANRSVAHYPAEDLRQLEMPPLAEFISAQLMLLSGTDHQANLVQWFAYLLAAAGASAIARDLGAGARGQSFAALLIVAMPAAATQAVNAKNDLVTALWGVALMWAAVRVWIGREFRVGHAAAVGAALALMLLTKGTGYFVAAPICLIVAIGGVRAAGWRAIPLGVAAVLIAALLNAPHWTRNYYEFGSPLGVPDSKGGHKLPSTTHTPAAIASTFVRNLTLHTNTPWKSVNEAQERAVLRLHDAMGIDPSDRRITIGQKATYKVVPSWKDDGNNAAPIHVALAAGVLGFLLVRPRRAFGLPCWPAYLVSFAAALLFAALLKWQPWHVRLHIPIVAVFVPCAAALLSGRPRLLGVLALPLAGIAFMGVLYNGSKPLVGPNSIIGKSREEVLFLSNPAMLDQARGIAAQAAALKPETLGFSIEAYTYEYPVMRVVLDRLKPAPHYFAAFPRFGTGFSTERPPPDVVIVYGRDAQRPLMDEPSKTMMVRAASSGRLNLMVPAAALPEIRSKVPIPPFYGWERDSGLRPLEGPYPQFQLPVVRWANKKTVTLTFRSDGEPSTLLMEVRRNDRQDQAMTISLNGEELRRFEFGSAWSFFPLETPLSPKAGMNTLTLEFDNLNEPGVERAALFRRLQILPASLVDAAPHAELPSSASGRLQAVPPELQRARPRQVPYAGFLCASISALCAVFTGIIAARRAARNRADALFFLVIGAFLSFSAAAVLVSLFHSFAPWPVALTQLLLLGAVRVAAGRIRPDTALHRPPAPPAADDPERPWRSSPVNMAIILLIAVFCAFTFVGQVVTPISGFDERMYHASRVCYWLQNRTLLAFDTHNDRQTVFPFGGELWLAWPLLFGGGELIGRLMFWAAYPLTIAAVAATTRLIGARTATALAAGLLYAATPTVLTHAVGFKSDHWLPFFSLACAYFVLRAPEGGASANRHWLAAGVALALAANVKTTALTLAPGVAVACLLSSRVWRVRFAGSGFVLLGLAAGFFLSGLSLVMAQNIARHGHALGPVEMQRVVRPDISLRQIAVHAARVPLTLAELPEVPLESLRGALEQKGKKAAGILGADASLALEENPAWPGSYSFRAPRLGDRYALGGLLWLPALAVWTVVILCGWGLGRMSPSLRSVVCLLALQIPVLAGAVFLVRWMGGGPERFWLGAYALSLPITALGVELIAKGRPVLLSLAGLGLLWQSSAAIRAESARLDYAIQHPATPAQLDEPYQKVVPLLPHGSRILLVCAGNSRDYPLFNPRAGYVNAVFPWGVHKFDPARMEAMIQTLNPTHILVENDRALGFHWAGGLRTDGMVAWLRTRPDLREIGLQTPGMRLFERHGARADGPE